MEKKCLVILALKNPQPEDVYALEQISQIYKFSPKIPKEVSCCCGLNMIQNQVYGQAGLSNHEESTSSSCSKSVQNLKIAQ